MDDKYNERQNLTSNLKLLETGHTCVRISSEIVKIFIVQSLIFSTEFSKTDIVALECFQCGIYVEESPPTLGLNKYNPKMKSEDFKVPKCNEFNVSSSIFRVTCKEYEKGCLKGWLTQVHCPQKVFPFATLRVQSYIDICGHRISY